jgi:threonine/homoserine/homoserine lactone efflux protein
MAKKRASRKSSGLNLSAPKEVTWIVAVVAGVLGILQNMGAFSIGVSAFVLVAVGFVILAVASLVKGL